MAGRGGALAWLGAAWRGEAAFAQRCLAFPVAGRRPEPLPLPAGRRLGLLRDLPRIVHRASLVKPPSATGRSGAATARPGADSRAAPAGCPTQVGRVRQRGPFRSTCGTSLRKARLELETRNSRGRTARLPRRSGHDRAGSLKSGVSRLPGTAPAMRPPDRLGGRAARGPLASGTPSTRIRGAGRRTRGPRIRPGGVAPPPGGP